MNNLLFREERRKAVMIQGDKNDGGVCRILIQREKENDIVEWVGRIDRTGLPGSMV